MTPWRFYDYPGYLIWTPSKPPVYGLQGGRLRNVASAETLGGRVRSERRGDDRLILSLEWRRLPLGDLVILDAIHASYGGNAAALRIEIPDGTLAGVLGGGLVPMRWPETRLDYTWVAHERYDVCVHLVEDVAKAIVMSGNISQDNAHLSIAAGTAFADLVGVNLAPYANGNYYLILTDSAGRRLAGWLKAAGTGETYGSDLLANGGFDGATAPWSPSNCTLASIADGQSGNCLEITCTAGAQQFATQTVTFTNGALYRAQCGVKSGTSGNEACYLLIYDAIQSRLASGLTGATWSNMSVYYTRRSQATAGNLWLVKSTETAGTMFFDSATLVQILTPSETGATMVGARGGTTYNWALEEPCFNRNDPDGYRYAVYSY